MRAATQSGAAPEVARDRILRAAARLYALRGYAGTSIREIAEDAGVTKPLVLYHFGSKERLFSTLLREAIDQCRGQAEAVARERTTATERLRALLGALCEQARQSPEILGFVHEVLSMPGILPLGFDYKTDGRQLFGAYVRLIEEGQRQGEFRSVHAPAVAVLAISAVGMYASAVLGGNLEAIPAHLEDTLFGLILHGVEVRR